MLGWDGGIGAERGLRQESSDPWSFPGAFSTHFHISPKKRRDGQRNNQIVIFLALTPEEIPPRGLNRLRWEKVLKMLCGEAQ